MKLQGKEKLLRRLRLVPSKVAVAARQADEQNAQEWVQWAQYFAPVDPIEGVYLRPSIRYHASNSGGWIVRAGGPTTTKDTPKGPYDYAVGVEYGTQTIVGRNYFWGAYRMLRRKFRSRRRRAVNKAIRELNNG